MGGAYTRGDVARICKVSKARLRYWERTALLEPRARADSQPAFAFRDLVSVKTVVSMLARGVPLRRIRRSVESLRRRVPELDRPLDALRVWMDGSDRVVVRHQGVLFEPNGQTVIDFTPPSRAAGGVAALEPRGGSATEAAAAEALEWFERGCQYDSDPATYQAAAEAYKRALEAAPDFADAHCNLGSVYFNLERRADARACFERAVELEARHLEANLNLATMLEEEGRNEAALGHYKVALEVNPLHSDTHVSLGLLYEKLGLSRKARGHWRRYLQLDPSGGWAALARRRLRG